MADLLIDKELLDAAVGCGKTAANIKAISVLLRGKEAIDGYVPVSIQMRNKLCDWLDDISATLDELSVAAGIDAEGSRG